MGESNSRTSDANRVHYHYANGPKIQIFRLESGRQFAKQPQHAKDANPQAENFPKSISAGSEARTKNFFRKIYFTRKLVCNLYWVLHADKAEGKN